MGYLATVTRYNCCAKYILKGWFWSIFCILKPLCNHSFWWRYRPIFQRYPNMWTVFWATVCEVERQRNPTRAIASATMSMTSHEESGEFSSELTSERNA